MYSEKEDCDTERDSGANRDASAGGAGDRDIPLTDNGPSVSNRPQHRTELPASGTLPFAGGFSSGPGLEEEIARKRKREMELADCEEVIRVVDVKKSFNGKVVLDGVSLTVRRGEIKVIMGASGGGKSTLLRCMIGAVKPDSGEIWVLGENIAGMGLSKLDAIRRRFGVLFQGGALLNSETVAANIGLPLRYHTRLDRETINLVARMKLALVGLPEAASKLPSELSGGMQKRAALARAIALDPEVVFYDEPSAGLDPIVMGKIDRLIMELSSKLNMTSIVITHELMSAFRIADHLVLLHNGKVLVEGTPDEIGRESDPFVHRFITGTPEPVKAGAVSTEDYLEELHRIKLTGRWQRDD